MKRLVLSLGQGLLLLVVLALVIIQHFHGQYLSGKVLDTFYPITSSTQAVSQTSTDTGYSSQILDLSTSERVLVTPTLTDLHFENTASVTSRPVPKSPLPQSYPGPEDVDDVQSTTNSASSELKTSQVLSVVCDGRSADPASLLAAEEYARSIVNSAPCDLPRLQCPELNNTRYSDLSHIKSVGRPRFFFAMNLHQSAHIMPQLFGAMIEAVKILGPSLCTISVVEGRSTDGTFEILKTLVKEMEHLGASYYLTCSGLQPGGEGAERISALAQLRNTALRPLIEDPEQFDPSTAVIFLNDIAPCAEDILELILQRELLQAHMTCGMDWYNLDDGEGGTFYDSWIGRQLNGETFFEVPQTTSWDFSKNLFWNHQESKSRYALGRPLQVFSCWNGAAVILARPFMDGILQFRTEVKGECHLGEPVHLAKDLWRLGYGRIAVVPSVNVAYSVEETRIAKEWHGSVSSFARNESAELNRIAWEDKPPGQIKCLEEEWHRPSWERLDFYD